MTTCHVNLRSLHVSGCPSCHFMFGRSLYFRIRPSLLTSPLATVGTSRNASGTGCALASYRIVQEKMNIPMSSVGVAALRTTLRFFGSEDSVKRKTPGCVHVWRAPPAAPPVETFVHALALTAAA